MFFTEKNKLCDDDNDDVDDDERKYIKKGIEDHRKLHCNALVPDRTYYVERALNRDNKSI